jgi:hypothetical protein
MYPTTGRFLMCFFHSVTATNKASISASKMTVLFPGYPKDAKCSGLSFKEKAERYNPLQSTRTPPKPPGQVSSLGEKEASVKMKNGVSHFAVTSRGFESAKQFLNTSKASTVRSLRLSPVEQ